ncbi:hypothetical protein VTN00DRAFT_7858 [Thermoascus crustaceus]|uniref:uncharacterized protein n=1 Tax=Thermoascus crustaceus TaxID=5088 RepID=UPI00374252E7
MACQPKENEHNAPNSEYLFDFVFAHDDGTPPQHVNSNNKETNSENLLLLLEPPRNFRRVQREMKKWVWSQYSDNLIQMGSPGVLSKTSVTNKSLLRAEIRMLRSLMEPLREDRMKMTIYWIDIGGPPDAHEMRRQLEIFIEYR